MPRPTPEQAKQLLEEYGMEPSFWQSEQEMLLAALVMELQAQRHSGEGPSDVGLFLQQQQQNEELEGGSERATYHSEHLEVSAGSYTEIGLSFVASEIDLRNITGPIEVGFADPSTDRNRIEYDSTDAPLVGIPATTSKVWVRAKSGTEQVDLEAWD